MIDRVSVVSARKRDKYDKDELHSILPDLLLI